MMIYPALFYLGAVLGSFIHVVVVRSLAGQSWLTGRSRCDNCHYQLSWYDNVPLLSYLCLRGKCRKCRRPIGSLHFWAEVMMGLVMVWWWQVAGKAMIGDFSWFTLIPSCVFLCFGCIGVVIVLADLKDMIIPDRATLLMLVLAVFWLVWRLLTAEIQLDDAISSVTTSLITLAGFGALTGLTKGRGMGLGDVKLAPVLALLIGWPVTLVGLLLAVFSGAVIGSGLLLTGRHQRHQPIPFGPFLILGFLLAIAYGQTLWHWYWTGVLGI